MSTTKEFTDGLWRGDRKCIDPKAGDADLWIKNWEELSVKAHRTKKVQKKQMSHIEKFVIEGNEKADELAKAGAMMDEGFMAEARAKTLQQEREEVYAVWQYAVSFHSSGGMEGL